MLVVVVRAASVEDFGNFASTQAVANILMVIFGIGLPTRLLRTERDAGPSLLGPSLLSSLATCLLVSMSLVIYGVTRTALGDWWLLAVIAYAVNEFTGNVLQAWLYGCQFSRRANWFMTFRRLVPLTVLLVVLARDVSVFVGLTLALSAGTVGSLLFILGVRIYLTGLSPLWRTSLDFWKVSIASIVPQVDIPLINALLGASSAAGYAAAARLTSPVHIVTNVLVSVMVPRVSSARAPAEQFAVARPYIRAGYLYAACLIVLSPVAWWLGPIVVGVQYEEYAWLFPLLLISSACGVMTQVLSGLLFARNATARVARVTVVSSAIAISGVIAAAAVGNVVVAGIGAVISQGLLMIVLSSWARTERQKQG